LWLSPILAPNTIRITAEQSLTEPGLYVASYVTAAGRRLFAEPRCSIQPGASPSVMRARVSAIPQRRNSNPFVQSRTHGIHCQQTGGELDSSLNSTTRRALAAQTGAITEIGRLLSGTSRRIIFALACFAAEWGIRRMKGLV